MCAMCERDPYTGGIICGPCLEENREHKKVKVPKFVAEWIGYCKFNRLTLLGAFDPVSELGVGLVTSLTEELRKGKDWAQRNQETFARAWLDGFVVSEDTLADNNEKK